MGFLKAFGRAVVQTPFALIKDTFTMGGAITDEESEVGKLIDDIRKDIND
jgi:ABC-type Fe3+-hydroxamate transport system substrate-binding protein